jgi:hypothetical protein
MVLWWDTQVGLPLQQQADKIPVSFFEAEGLDFLLYAIILLNRLLQ